jgi:hypothetical protein
MMVDLIETDEAGLISGKNILATVSDADELANRIWRSCALQGAS